MTIDLILAILHHVAVFALFGQLIAEAVLLRPGMTAADVPRIARLDAGYGATAGAVLIIGIVRVSYGAKGGDYYQGNHWFWAKMAVFALVALSSIRPPCATCAGARPCAPIRLCARRARDRGRAGLVRLQRPVRADPIFAAAMARFT